MLGTRTSTFVLAMMIFFALLSCLPRAAQENKAVHVYVDAKSNWVDTGMRVAKGQALFFRCTGTWAVAPENERERWPDAGADGHGNHPGESVHRRGDPKKELPGVPFGTLLGKVDGLVFPIGTQHRLIMPAGGKLYLVVNDYPFYRHDNRGGLHVVIARE